MSVSSITVVYHPKCSASVNFLIKTKEIKDVDIQYINYIEDSFESDIDIDIVPLIIINNDISQVFKGLKAYHKLEEIKHNNNTSKKNKTVLSYGNKQVTFMPDDGKKTKIDLEAKF